VRGWLLSLGTLALVGCSSLPETPALRPAPAGWTEADIPSGAPGSDRWWIGFADPRLSRLAEAAAASDDVALAEARLTEARGRLRAAGGALAPQLAAAASVARDESGELRQDTAEAVGVLSFDPDLSGAIRLRRRSALAASEAAEERLRDVRLASRETAVRLYVTYREALARAAAAERSVAALRDSLGLARSRARAGLTSGLDVASAEAALAQAESRPPAAREAATQARLGLEALLGLSPGALAGELSLDEHVPAAPVAAALQTPVAVLSRRPDLRAAERDLAAAS
jgi:multidrug efflux system outer membrane protein